MSKKIVLTAAFATLALVLSACGSKPAATNTTSNTTTKPAGNSNASTAKKESPKATTKIQNEKKPEGQTAKAPAAQKKVQVPEDWIYMADEVKGYGFWLPDGSVGDSANVDGVDAFVAQTPAPSEVGVIVFAWKDKTLTKEDLLKMAVQTLAEMGETVTAGELKGESEDYAVAEATSTNAEGKKSKMKILVGTDVTDNYVMIVGTDESKFAANEEIVDMIWGNFEMYSGGASGRG